ncbi:MAG: hypothetical protein ACKOA8_19965 [Deltaproteobacteria bacterium]
MTNRSENSVTQEEQTLKPKIKVIDSLSTFFVALILVGPFSLPLLWRNPRLKKSTKWVGSIAVVLFTLFLIFVAGSYIDQLLAELKQTMGQPN